MLLPSCTATPFELSPVLDPLTVFRNLLNIRLAGATQVRLVPAVSLAQITKWRLAYPPKIGDNMLRSTAISCCDRDTYRLFVVVNFVAYSIHAS